MLLDHVDFRVRDFETARRFYDALLPALGLSRINADDESAGYHQPAETGGEAFFWVVSDPQHRPSGTRVALHAASRSEVDRLAAIAQDAGAENFEPPDLITEYGANYYAAFFEDPEGNKLEICCRLAAI